MRKHPELWQKRNVLPGSNTYLVSVRPEPSQASQLYEMAAGSILPMSKERLRVVSYHGLGTGYVGTKVYVSEVRCLGYLGITTGMWIARTLLSPSPF